MAKLNIKPLADRVIVAPSAAETTTASGIIIPDTAQEKPQKGNIVALGNGKKDVMEILCSKDNKFKTSQEETSLHEFTDLSCSKSIVESIKGAIHIIRKHLHSKKLNLIT